MLEYPPVCLYGDSTTRFCATVTGRMPKLNGNAAEPATGGRCVAIVGMGTRSGLFTLTGTGTAAGLGRGAGRATGTMGFFGGTGAKGLVDSCGRATDGLMMGSGRSRGGLANGPGRFTDGLENDSGRSREGRMSCGGLGRRLGRGTSVVSRTSSLVSVSSSDGR